MANSLGGSAQAYFRKAPAYQSNPGAVAAWLRQGEIEAAKINCASYNASRFKETLQQVRALTVEPPELFQPEVVRLCAAVGVAVVFLPELSNTRTCGATQWLSHDQALIQLSLRYKTDDHLWFTFFHEAGHVLLHPKRNVFVEFEEKYEDQQEQEANTFAADLLIPPVEWKRFLASAQKRSKAAILQFASDAGIAPGIVVGRLQHRDTQVLPHNHCNCLKRKLKWVSNE